MSKILELEIHFVCATSFFFPCVCYATILHRKLQNAVFGVKLKQNTVVKAATIIAENAFLILFFMFIFPTQQTKQPSHLANIQRTGEQMHEFGPTEGPLIRSKPERVPVLSKRRAGLCFVYIAFVPILWDFESEKGRGSRGLGLGFVGRGEGRMREGEWGHQYRVRVEEVARVVGS